MVHLIYTARIPRVEWYRNWDVNRFDIVVYCYSLTIITDDY